MENDKENLYKNKYLICIYDKYDDLVALYDNPKQMAKAEQVAKCGNAVCPPVATALVKANFATEISQTYKSMKDLYLNKSYSQGLLRRYK